MVSALHRQVAFAGSDREAVQRVNCRTPPHLPHSLSRTSLRRMWDTLPPPLRDPDTSSETLLLEHIHTYQSAQRQQQNSGLALLSAVEEALLVEWIVRQYNIVREGRSESESHELHSRPVRAKEREARLSQLVQPPLTFEL